MPNMIASLRTLRAGLLGRGSSLLAATALFLMLGLPAAFAGAKGGAGAGAGAGGGGGGGGGSTDEGIGTLPALWGGPGLAPAMGGWM